MTHAQVIILDFGSQYTQLIGRKIRELGVYCEIVPYSKVDSLSSMTKAVILSGSPFSCLDENALFVNVNQLSSKYPVFAVCYGAQLVANQFGGKVARSNTREYGKAKFSFSEDDRLFKNVSTDAQVWMSHSDTIHQLPDGFKLLGRSDDVSIAAFKRADAGGLPLYAVQFHPEVAHTLPGKQILSNFLFEIANIRQDWTPAFFVEETIASLQEMIGPDHHVMMALSGGVDSTVAATLLHRAVGERLHCVFVDNGLLRKNEFQEVLAIYQRIGLSVNGVDEKQKFWTELAGISDPEMKRKTIGRLFIEIFEEEAVQDNRITFLGQGTIYPDIIESVSVHGPSVTIKSHHNVGGLPDKLNLKIIEPLKSLFKDEVRKVGHELGIPADILNRHPFPGPGLAIRIIGAVDQEKVELLQEADFIYTQALKSHGIYGDIWQAGAILLPVQTVGVMGDERTFDRVLALRAVNSSDGMTAEWSKIPFDILAEISSKIINQVNGINRVVYDISTKPPATIEWE